MKIFDAPVHSRKAALFAVVLVVSVLLGAIAGGGLAQDGDSEEPITQQELLRTSIDSQNGPQTVWVRRVEFAPDAAMASEPEIEHPAQEFVFVLDGTATMVREGDDPLEFTAGDAWHNDLAQAHTLQNASSTEPLAVIAVWIGEEGAF